MVIVDGGNDFRVDELIWACESMVSLSLAPSNLDEDIWAMMFQALQQARQMQKERDVDEGCLSRYELTMVEQRTWV